MSDHDDHTPEPPAEQGSAEQRPAEPSAASSPAQPVAAEPAAEPTPAEAAAAEATPAETTPAEQGPAHLAGAHEPPPPGGDGAGRGGVWSAPGRRVAIVVGIVVMVVAAGIGMSSALSGDGDDAATDASTTTTERPTTTEAPTTTAPPETTTTLPPETTTTAPPETTTTLPPAPEADGTLELGESGDAVAALQARLVELGYWMGEPDGTYGQLTRQAVMAFQKVEGLGRDGVAGPATQGQLAAAGRPTPRGGDGVEIDLERQVIFIVQGGQVQWTLNTSTGSGETYTSSSGGSARAVTPPGDFRVQREIDGLREAPLGTLYRPKYFNGGIAVHGSGSIPANPASHGCARVTNAAMDMIWSSGAMAIGVPVSVY